ncbi:hypothetical protein FGF66_03415 [Chlorobaculum thiosulfatiphilum]|uniref:Uncharacterized protein n=1 Tax=Chlorobaculum thiosulfatiphilum TaxID=115852 RepID=A0A5C4S8D1_CHLTI|nr:hypothetical protein [Chlorobaculum thiosulfatiphilum]TNJ39686.1 hypothetical protein FGF66_03415 [Chlorobaculum thiosulfatiphilum]
MAEENTPLRILDYGISDKETFLIGRIISQWGAIEHEIFMQCLLTYDDKEKIALPKAMNNLSFTDILDLWKERVANKEKLKERQEILLQQYENIKSLKDYRNALIHGMWNWNIDEPEVIKTIRIRKKEIITVKFKTEDLEDFFKQVARILFHVKYPGGIGELMEERMARGMYISRTGYEMLFGEKKPDE